MFADIGTARAVLEDCFNEPGVELLISLLQPVIVFEPLEKDGAPKLGATRIGGTPDLPHGQPWPVRSVPRNAAAIAARGGNAHGDHLRKHLVQALPLQFAAQVDLAEAVSLGDVAVDLPNEGRL